MTATIDELEAAPPARLDVPVCRALDHQTELRAADPESSSPGTLVGEFSLFDQWYEIRSYWEGNFLERISPGAFKRTINNRSGETPVRCLLEHGYDPTVGDKPLGVPDVLEERDNGAYAETPLLDTSYNRDLAPALSAGAYGQSFRFQVLRDEWVEEPEASEQNPKGIPERTITEVRLIEYGPTVFPASPSTNDTTGLRSTTDSYYERLQRRDQSRYDAALENVRSVRAPATAPTPGAPSTARKAAPEDPQPKHSEDSARATGTGHSTDPQTASHSRDTSNTTHQKNRNAAMADNMTTEEREARNSEIRARLQEIDGEHSGGALPDEVRSEWDNLTTELRTNTQAIEDQERRRAELAEILGNDDATEGGSDTSARTATAARRRNAPSTPKRRTENIYDLAEARTAARSVDELPEIYRDNARRAVELAQFPGAESRSAAQERVTRLLDSVDDNSASLARRILVTGSPTYERAFGKAMAAMSTNGLTGEEQRALSVGVDTEGGYAVPFQLDPTVMLTSGGVIDPLRQISRVVQITGKTWQGVTSAGVTVSRKAEKAEADDNSPSFAQPEVTTSRVDGFVPFTVEVEQDWAQMKAELTMLLAEAKADEEADSFVNGTGTANAGTGNEPEGILAGITAAQNVSTAAANAFSDADLYALLESLPPRFRSRSSWFAELSFYNTARQLSSNSDGSALWERLGAGTPSQLIGRPVAEGSEMPSFATTTAAPLAVLGDFSKFLIVDRVGMQVELVPHLFGANRRPTGMRGIYVWWRNGSKVLVPNAFRRLVVDGV